MDDNLLNKEYWWEFLKNMLPINSDIIQKTG